MCACSPVGVPSGTLRYWLGQPPDGGAPCVLLWLWLDGSDSWGECGGWGALQGPGGSLQNRHGASARYPHTEEWNQLCSPGPGWSPQLLGSSCSAPAFSTCSLACTETVKLARSFLSGGTALNTGVRSMCSGEGRAQHPPGLPSWTCLERSGFDCCLL